MGLSAYARAFGSGFSATTAFGNIMLRVPLAFHRTARRQIAEHSDRLAESLMNAADSGTPDARVSPRIYPWMMGSVTNLAVMLCLAQLSLDYVAQPLEPTSPQKPAQVTAPKL